jgi:molecular chaperone DnaK (HSP70)
MQKGVFKVKSTNGNIYLDGEDSDGVLVNHLLTGFKEGGHDLSNDLSNGDLVYPRGGRNGQY